MQWLIIDWSIRRILATTLADFCLLLGTQPASVKVVFKILQKGATNLIIWLTNHQLFVLLKISCLLVMTVARLKASIIAIVGMSSVSSAVRHLSRCIDGCMSCVCVFERGWRRGHFSLCQDVLVWSLCRREVRTMFFLRSSLFSVLRTNRFSMHCLSRVQTLQRYRKSPKFKCEFRKLIIDQKNLVIVNLIQVFKKAHWYRCYRAFQPSSSLLGCFIKWAHSKRVECCILRAPLSTVVTGVRYILWIIIYSTADFWLFQPLQ